MQTYYTVYKITNTVNNKTYIGVHETKNLDDEYYGDNQELKDAIAEHGIENFTKEYLVICNDKGEIWSKSLTPFLSVVPQT